MTRIIAVAVCAAGVISAAECQVDTVANYVSNYGFGKGSCTITAVTLAGGIAQLTISQFTFVDTGISLQPSQLLITPLRDVHGLGLQISSTVPWTPDGNRRIDNDVQYIATVTSTAMDWPGIDRLYTEVTGAVVSPGFDRVVEVYCPGGFTLPPDQQCPATNGLAQTLYVDASAPGKGTAMHFGSPLFSPGPKGSCSGTGLTRTCVYSSIAVNKDMDANGLSGGSATINTVANQFGPQVPQIIVGNNAAFGDGPLQTYNFSIEGGAPIASFIPTGAQSDDNNGRGVYVSGNNVYYTELVGNEGFGPTDFIRVAPFNRGTGGADIKTLPSPRPGTGIQDLSISNGVLYVLTGYPTSPPEVFGLNPSTGAVLSGPILIALPAAVDSDGFTVMPNGNFLINSGSGSCTYNQFNPSTGALIPSTTITVPVVAVNPLPCTGVDTDGSFLYFQTNENSFTQTALDGTLVKTLNVIEEIQVEDLSLVHP
ncbi:MAG: hypothetical protein JO099_08230 [Acidobacteriia bacterium]|nr:hypothetical protein [Terriglobia bacterium]